MSTARFKFRFSEGASKLHKEVGYVLRTGVFKGHKAYQEYPCKLIDPKFKTRREKFDWYIPTLSLAIECHGEQHFQPVRFGGMSQEQALMGLKERQALDIFKKYTANKMGVAVAIVRYDETPSEKLIWMKREEELKLIAKSFSPGT